MFLRTPVGQLCLALESGGYDARPTKLTHGCGPCFSSELKIESLEAVLSTVTFDASKIKLKP